MGYDIISTTHVIDMKSMHQSYKSKEAVPQKLHYDTASGRLIYQSVVKA